MIALKKLYMGCFDALLVKYGASVIGYAIVALPVFGPNSAVYLKKVQNEPGVITKDWMRNSSLLINLAKAIGRIVISYKELQNLAGYTTLIYQFKQVVYELAPRPNTLSQSESNSQYTPYIKFEQVDITTPNPNSGRDNKARGEVLIRDLSFEIKENQHLIVTGPNGCGTTSLFRCLSGLWPLEQGRILKPLSHSLFFIPQKPYLPKGTLRDQIIYPHNHTTMKAN